MRRKGDWSVKRPDTEPSGWAFEFANEFYPDIDDTAMVLLALLHAKASDPAGAGRRRAPRHQLAAGHAVGRRRLGGLRRGQQLGRPQPGALRRPQRHARPHLPRHHRPRAGMRCAAAAWRGHDAVRRGVAYLLQAQEKDGSWYGRWGVNYIYGSFLAMRGLARQRRARRAATPSPRGRRWLRAVQNPDGGWGESCASYDRDRFVPAPSCPSQTAWALLGLLAAGDRDSAQLRRGVEFLLDRQRPTAPGPRTPPPAPASPTSST